MNFRERRAALSTFFIANHRFSDSIPDIMPAKKWTQHCNVVPNPLSIHGTRLKCSFYSLFFGKVEYAEYVAASPHIIYNWLRSRWTIYSPESFSSLFFSGFLPAPPNTITRMSSNGRRNRPIPYARTSPLCGSHYFCSVLQLCDNSFSLATVFGVNMLAGMHAFRFISICRSLSFSVYAIGHLKRMRI